MDMYYSFDVSCRLHTHQGNLCATGVSNMIVTRTRKVIPLDPVDSNKKNDLAKNGKHRLQKETEHAMKIYFVYGQRYSNINQPRGKSHPPISLGKEDSLTPQLTSFIKDCLRGEE